MNWEDNKWTWIGVVIVGLLILYFVFW